MVLSHTRPKPTIIISVSVDPAYIAQPQFASELDFRILYHESLTHKSITAVTQHLREQLYTNTSTHKFSTHNGSYIVVISRLYIVITIAITTIITIYVVPNLNP